VDTRHANDERFNAIAAEWDDDPYRVLMAQKVARAMRAALSPSGQERALEFGAGTGLITLLMVPRLRRLTAMDSSTGMLAVLRQKCARKGLAQVEIVEGSVPEQLPDATFDLIYSSMTLHHIDDVPGLLRLLAAHLEVGGRVALADLDIEDGGFHGGVPGIAHHGFDREVFAGWLRAAGFDEIQFSTAFTLRKARDDGGNADYPIFLAVARKL